MDKACISPFLKIPQSQRSLDNSIRSSLVEQLHRNFLKRCAMHRSKVWLASALLDASVWNTAGEDLGKIEDVVIDPVTGNLQYAILSFGGVLGMNKKLFPIPWSSFSSARTRDYVLLDTNKDTLRRAPGFRARCLARRCRSSLESKY